MQPINYVVIAAVDGLYIYMACWFTTVILHLHTARHGKAQRGPGGSTRGTRGVYIFMYICMWIYFVYIYTFSWLGGLGLWMEGREGRRENCLKHGGGETKYTQAKIRLKIVISFLEYTWSRWHGHIICSNTRWFFYKIKEVLYSDDKIQPSHRAQ